MELPSIAATTGGEDDYKKEYHGFTEDVELIIDDHRGKYIRNSTTASNFLSFMLKYNCNQHLKIKLTLPLKYMHLEVGDNVRFDKIIGNTLPYGIDYSMDAEWTHSSDSSHIYRGTYLNGQQIYPDFMVVSTNKKLDSVDIEVIQMHNLSSTITYKGIEGCTNPNALNYKSTATMDNNTCILIPQDANSGDNAIFMDLVSLLCPILSSGEEDYNLNYDEDRANDQGLIGEELIFSNSHINHGNYDINSISHMALLKYQYATSDGSDLLTPAITSNDIRLYDAGRCYAEDVIEPKLAYLDGRLKIFDRETVSNDVDNQILYDDRYLPASGSYMTYEATIIENRVVGFYTRYNDVLYGKGRPYHIYPIPTYNQSWQGDYTENYNVVLSGQSIMIDTRYGALGGAELTFPIHSVKVYFQDIFYVRGYDSLVHQSPFSSALNSDAQVFDSSHFSENAMNTLTFDDFVLYSPDGLLFGANYMEYYNHPQLYTLNFIVEVYSDRGGSDPFLEYQSVRKMVLGHFLNSDGTLFIPAPDFELWGVQFG